MLIFPTEKRLDISRAPFILIALILLNTLVYFTYQIDDNERAGQAIERYLELDYLDKEYPIFIEYLENEQDSSTLERVQESYYEEYYQNVVAMILMHSEFNTYLERRAKTEFEASFYNGWRNQRKEIQEKFESISSFAHGLVSNDVSIGDLFTHQFLHGSVSHLVGNMVFLFIFGYAVEAAIGHLRFLLFYLIGGVFAGLAQVVTHLDSGVPLVGASGAISGVMAMYLAVFRLRKIEFFYWIFFFVGYFRAPALLILPFYIGKEIYSYMTAIDSNVAFMAHAGGFVAGAILIGISLFLTPTILNNEYIEEDQDFTLRQKALSKIYAAIEALRFESALTQVNQLIDSESLDFELAMIRYNLNRVLRNKSFTKELNELLSMAPLIDAEKKRVGDVWLESGDRFSTLTPDELVRVGLKLVTRGDARASKSIHDKLFVLSKKPADLNVLTKNLLEYFVQTKDQQNLSLYKERYQAIAKEGAHGNL
ncbi:rhomboid family intramembrane serine protease [Reinekea sp.]|jgi:membrane associated rhomboid family serine protease|uniref:rhomboid family intramembrane serine protease n=1 Tax=Reinekea sp. TaxID=1970455 RepID=UPI00398953F9